VLRLAGVLTQLACGTCLLIGTIGLVLVQQNKTGGVGSVIGWLATAMAGLVFGGLIYRGGLVSMLVAAAIDAGFGLILITIEYDTLRKLLKILPASDVGTIGDGLQGAGYAMIGASAMCLLALPQGIRFARWFRTAAATRNAMSTAPGFPPPPVPARGSAYVIPSEDQPPPRRRLYMVLGGLAVGIGAGVGVLVSSARPAGSTSGQVGAAVAGSGSGKALPGTGSGRVTQVVTPQIVTPQIVTPQIVRPQIEARVPSDARDVPLDDAAVASVPLADARGGAVTIPPVDTVQRLVAAQRAAIASGDARALAGYLIGDAFGFGVDAGEVAEGRDAVAAQLAGDLGNPPAGGFTVESTALAIGQERDHAWIAEELDVTAPGGEPRHFAITELAAAIDGSWRVVALHWATPVTDATAQRRAILKTLPVPQPIADRHDGADELDQAVRAAFASKAAFADARSERPDAFNYGSGGERAHGGTGIKRIFTKLKAQIRIHDGARVVAGGQWDPAQKAAPWIGWAALNVDFTSRTRAATDVTQTLRVLAILLKEGADWKIVQTQWSNGGPVR
jgi:ketosteroid isomerase-like protein